MPSYSQYKRQLAVLDADDTDIEAWITVKGNHIPIKKGQSKEEAVKSFIESKNGGGKSAEPKKSGTLENVARANKWWGKQESNGYTGVFKRELHDFHKELKGLEGKSPDDPKVLEAMERAKRAEKYWKDTSKKEGGYGMTGLMHREWKDINKSLKKDSKSYTKIPNGATAYGFGGVPDSVAERHIKTVKEPSNTKKDMLALFSQKYDESYGKRNPDRALVKEFDDRMANDPAFQKEVQEFVKQRGDVLSSDREVDAFMQAYKESTKPSEKKLSKPSDSDMSGGSINNIFQQANAGLQSFVDDTGYQPQTTFWSDFGIAEPFGEKAIEDTYNRAFREWKNDKVYLTELSMMLNWKLWQHYDKGNDKMARLYDKLWKQTDEYAHTHLKGDDLQYYIRTTD